MKKFVILIFMLSVSLLCNCKNQDNEKIVSIGGSTTVSPILDEMILKYNKINNNTKVTYDAQGSSVGINGLFNKIYKIAISSRDLTKEEIEQGAKETVFAYDALIFITSPEIKITNITEENLAKILNGKIQNWKQVGGPDAKINFINRDSSSGSYLSIKDLLLNKIFKTHEESQFRQDGMVVKSNGEVIEKTSLTPYSIGYIGLGYAKNSIEKGLNILSINSTYPTKETINSNKYTIKRNLTIVTNNKYEDKSITQFIDFMTSSIGQDIVEEQGFLGVKT
ncbi:PstS family phosphate ABC transporter substrate-binding protein [Borreliella garinii]|uniref:PstS family phosphate ABC transporter substrate-binding protein n=1 Tax=Borreliella garinii TaxID=29519 RepID=UPI00292F4AE9|nr:phosphate ABC transporter substrate-binding protein [Borreliella garinii]WNZ73377.1 phosphate ABC transporter substrate-binding protein [Borreliella garinii]WNZ74357.1 phosphate ABC transporter substrate-binding protein [Borreliella garinii]